MHPNVAEGTSRPTKKAFAHYVVYARGSLREVESAIAQVRRSRPRLAPQVDRLQVRIRRIEQLLARPRRFLAS